MKSEDKLRLKIKEMIDVCPLARKDYGYIDLCHRINKICLMNYDENSDPKLLDNLYKLGFRIIRLNNEFGETECNRLVDKAIDEMFKVWRKSDMFFENAIQNIDWLLKLYREQKQQLNI